MYLLLERCGVKRLLLAAALLAAFGTTAQAQKEKLKDGPHAAFITGGDVRNEDFAYGWQAAYEINDILSFEASLTKQGDEVQHAVDDVTIPSGFNLDLEIYAIALSARVGFDVLERVHLYAAGGVGYYIIKSDNEEVREIISARNDGEAAPGQLLGLNIDVDNDFGLHAGAGFEIRLHQNWEIFAEYRYVALNPDAKVEITEQFPAPDDSVPFVRTTTEIPDELEYSYNMFRAGINYRF